MDQLFEREYERLKTNRYINHNHIVLSKVEPDYAEMYVDIVPESRNQIGSVHGGLYFSMADCCAGITSRTDGRKYVTQNAQVNYIRAGKEGRITAKSRMIHRGHSGCLSDVNIFDEEETLLFAARFFFYCVEQ